MIDFCQKTGAGNDPHSADTHEARDQPDDAGRVDARQALSETPAPGRLNAGKDMPVRRGDRE